VTNDGLHRLERFFEQAARKVGGGGLHPVEVLRHVQVAYEASVHEGVAGNDITVAFHPEDYAHYRRAFSSLREEIVSLVSEVEARQRVRRIGDVRVRFESTETATAGVPTVSVRFADTSVPAGTRPGPTARIVRHRGIELVADGERLPLTHTPFSIGRGTGNDLVLPDLSVSRRHAEIDWTAEGFEITDTGSRNGLWAGGTRIDRILLTPGIHVTLGDVELWLEERSTVL
jgi:hypothetical protein